MSKKYFTPSQLKAARALIGWNQQQLADSSGAGVATIRVFEGGRSELQTGTETIIKQALEAAGVIFIPENGEGAGVRLRKLPAQIDLEESTAKGGEDGAVLSQ